MKTINELKDTLFHFATENDIDVDTIQVCAGAAGFLHGIRDTYDDIDVSLDEEDYDRIKDKYKEYGEMTIYSAHPVYSIPDGIDFHRGHLTSDTTKVSGITTLSVNALVEHKLKLANQGGRSLTKRTQDIKDIVKLKGNVGAVHKMISKETDKLIGDIGDIVIEYVDDVEVIYAREEIAYQDKKILVIKISPDVVIEAMLEGAVEFPIKEFNETICHLASQFKAR